ncbi:MAG: serine hydrolase domain-containing protein [Acidimicrobiia bacterium]
MQIEGTVAPGFEPVADAFASNFDEHDEVGAACSLYLNGEPVVDIWGGLAEVDPPRPWAKDTIVIVYSCTKGATAVCANKLIQEGRLDPDAPVADYWPEFAANGKSSITVAWALSHRAGLAEVQGDFTLDDVAAWDPIVEGIAAQAPVWDPGTKHGYHTRAYGWIVGEIIRRITGVSPGTYFSQEIAAPLDLDFHIGVSEQLDPRVARMYPVQYDAETQALVDAVLSDQSTLMGRVMSGPSQLFAYNDMWNTRQLRAAEMPSSNGHSDARSLARMYAACIGEVDGVRLLTDETVERASQVLSDGPDCVVGQPLTIGLGFMLAPTFPPGVGPRTFGHSGAGGSTAFADPDRGLAFAYVMSQMKMSMTNLDPRGGALVKAAYEALS